MKKYVCIHGHFYQPPRENPWLNAVEVQDSAYPFHDWNSRITDELLCPQLCFPHSGTEKEKSLTLSIIIAA